jgi:hypothetical protein
MHHEQPVGQHDAAGVSAVTAVSPEIPGIPSLFSTTEGFFNNRRWICEG